MKSPFVRPGAVPPGLRLVHQCAFFTALIFSLTIQSTLAGSATWNSSSDFFGWEYALNWLPNTVPDAPGDVATFGSIGTPSASIGSSHEIDSIVFSPGALAFTIYVNDQDFAVSGAGLVNNSAVIQYFEVRPIPFADGGGFPNVFYLRGNATAGNLTQITNVNGDNEAFGGILAFENDSTADTAAIFSIGSPEIYPGFTEFDDSSSAAEATITNQPGSGLSGGACCFYDSSTAGSATIINNAALVSDGGGGQVDFNDSSNAADSTIICNGNPVGSSYPAEVTFHGDSSGGKARIMLFGDGQLSVGRHNPPGLTIGSLEGDGVVVLTYLSSYDLITLGIGSNNRSTTFAGVIQDRITQSGGSLSKVGTGTLTLTGASTYTGGTTVSSGMLRVSNQTGSGTGTGRVKVRGGTLGGKGTIAGAVTIAGRSGRGAFLAPSIGAANPATLTIQRVLTFEANGSYVYKLNSARLKGDMVVSNGLTIYSGAQFAGSDVGGTVFPPGTVLTAINNTSTAAISGTFSNLADGGAITIGNNTFQADYEGGDGNDLTLTVVQ